MHSLIGLILVLFAASASAGQFSPLGTQCLDVVAVVECNNDAAVDTSEQCRDSALFGDGVYAVAVDPPLSSNPFSHVTLRVGVDDVDGCERSIHGGLVCAIAPDLAGVFRLFVAEAGSFDNFSDCQKDFLIQLPLTPRQDRTGE